MDVMSAVTAFSAVLAPMEKPSEKGLEICAVDEQSKNLLRTLQHVAGQLDDARLLRHQKSSLFDPFEKRMFDDTFRHTEEAIRHVAALAERPMADLEIVGGQLRTNTRLLFLLRDSPNLHISLTQLSIASQSLNATIVQLGSRGGQQHRSSVSSSLSSPRSPPLSQGELKATPTYEEGTFLREGRRRNMQRRASAMTMSDRPGSAQDRPHSAASQHIQSHITPTIPELVGDEDFGDNTDTTTPAIRVSQVASNSAVPDSTPETQNSTEDTQTASLSPPRSPGAQSSLTNASSTTPPEIDLPASRMSPPPDPGIIAQLDNNSPPRNLNIITPLNNTETHSNIPFHAPFRNMDSQYNLPIRAPQPGFPPPGMAPFPSHLGPRRDSDTRLPPINLPPRTSMEMRTSPPQPPFAGMALPPNNLSPPRTSDLRRPVEYIPPRRSLEMRGPTPEIPPPGSRIRPPPPPPPPPPAETPLNSDVYWQSRSYATTNPQNLGIYTDQKHPYVPSIARRGRGGRARSQGWMEARAQ